MRFHQEITMGRMLTLFGAQWVKEKKRHSTMFFFFNRCLGWVSQSTAEISFSDLIGCCLSAER